MTTKSMAYDHPAYTGVREMGLGALSGSGGASTKFAAFTAKILKSVTLKPTAAGTSNDVCSLIQISGTTTTTTALATFGSAATAFQNVALSSGGVSLAQGDTYYVVKGTDATLALIGELEVVTQPLAAVTQ